MTREFKDVESVYMFGGTSIARAFVRDEEGTKYKFKEDTHVIKMVEYE